jgi:SAM-dependent methyltransferase
MDVCERLSLEAASAETLMACEHRHRYELATRLCAGMRVLDLCCGSGYGSEMLAATASEVVGVDNDMTTIDLAQATVGRRAGVGFEAADAVEYVQRDLGSRFDAIVCFEGIEHLHDVDVVLAALREYAQAGMRIVSSIPNSKLFEEDNPFHVTEFGYEETRDAFAGFPSTTLLPQYLAEGSLICPEEATETDVTLSLDDRLEPESANHFIVCVNFDATQLTAAHRGQLQVNAAPAYNSYMRALERANDDLRRANSWLARDRLGKSGSAAASALRRFEERCAAFEAEASSWRARYEAAEQQRAADPEPASPLLRRLMSTRRLVRRYARRS